MFRRIFLFLAFNFALCAASAQTEDLFRLAPADFQSRIDFFSQKFLDKPYALNPLGEGDFDSIDQDPLYSFDQFDCMTYMETVISLALSQNLDMFQQQMKRLRYENGEVAFGKRHHFAESGWISGGEKLGLFKDRTADLFPNQVQTQSVKLRIPAWYRGLNIEKLGSSSLTVSQRREKIEALAQKAHNLTVHLSYLPKETILSDPKLLEKIPNGSMVFFVVGPSLKIRQTAVTDLLVLHAGFVFQRGKKTVLRDASSRKNNLKVVEEDLFSFVKSDLRIPTLQGIHIESFQPGLKPSP